jgi:alpha-amylase
MGWGWGSHRMMNAIAQGKKTVKDWDETTKNLVSKFAPDDILMNFTSSHDENSWNGSEYKRLGDAVETFAVLTYMIKGMPLIYDGQEYDFKNTLKFFTKDQITHTKGTRFLHKARNIR